ncbi:MAG: mevalonate kinase [Euryarchaeota archaeon]|nr:mevalonate kinase [Euryarchaeota archaeon]
MIVASAPGKVILFGEHAVVYGEPALVGAIERRVRVSARRLKEGVLRVYSDALGEGREFSLDELQDAGGAFRYVKRAVGVAFEEAGESSGLELRISSELPPASGLGSSAAVAVATLKAVLALLGADVGAERLASLGHRVELEVQGSASPTDTAAATYGGVLFVRPGRGIERLSLEGELPLIVGNTRKERSTKLLVARVRELREALPEVVDPIIGSIGRVTREARRCLEEGELSRVGMLMNINHGLLEALGVSTEELSRLVHIARSAGAEGAKLTGAGGGGCMLALAGERHGRVLEALGKRCEAMPAGVTFQGVRIEGGR